MKVPSSTNVWTIMRLTSAQQMKSDGINVLTVERFKSGNQPLHSGYKSIRSKESSNKLNRYGVMCENKKQLVPSSMMFLSFFLVLTSNIMMCAEDNDIRMNADTNKIVRTNINAIRRTANGKHTNEKETQRIGKRHVSENTFKAFECNEESDLSAAEFSLNEPTSL